MIIDSVHTLYHVWVGFSILLSEVVNSALNGRSGLVLILCLLSRIVLDTPTYAAGIVEMIVGLVPMILATVVESPTTSYYRTLKRSLSHWPKPLALLNQCSGCWSAV